jgi:hypothetical protein
MLIHKAAHRNSEFGDGLFWIGSNRRRHLREEATIKIDYCQISLAGPHIRDDCNQVGIQ